MTTDDQVRRNARFRRAHPELAAMLDGDDECPACGSWFFRTAFDRAIHRCSACGHEWPAATPHLHRPAEG